MEPLKSFSSEHEASTEILKKKEQIMMPEEEESEDDPWEKVNQKTVQRFKEIKEKRKEMNVDMVLKHYQE